MGLPTSTAILAATMFQVGGIAGALGSGPLVTKYGTEKVVSAMLAMGAIWLVLLGATTVATTLLIVFIFGAGIGISAGQLGINALPGAIYPPRIRNTGAGWSLGIGRLGNIGGPLLGGQMLALGWAPEEHAAGDLGPGLLAGRDAAGAGEGACQLLLASNASLQELSTTEGRAAARMGRGVRT